MDKSLGYHYRDISDYNIRAKFFGNIERDTFSVWFNTAGQERGDFSE
ncbi:hypothetical protein [Shewanella sp. YLB-07]|nr:hypothetical protein [Shewanella sp. YLB-07]